MSCFFQKNDFFRDDYLVKKRLKALMTLES